MNIFKPQNPCPKYPLRFFSFLIFFSTTSPSVEAQASSPPPQNQLYNPSFTPSMGVIIMLLTASLFFMAVFSLYLRHCSPQQTPSSRSIRSTFSLRRGAVVARGLHADVLETFPTFSYAEVKDKRIGKVGVGLECAVCLSEFEDHETLRLLPKCDHVFHAQCIDDWLENHVTCPVCRANLDGVEAAPPLEPPLVVEGQQVVSTVREQGRNDDVLVGVDCDEDEQNVRPVLNRNGSLNRVLRSWSIKIRRPIMLGFGRFRSHSTGHLLVLPGEDLDRYTLRLPAGVRREMLNRALLNRNESCVGRVEGGGSLREGIRTGGVRFIGRKIDIPDRGARSDRWAFFNRVLSMKSPKVVGNVFGSTSKSPRSSKSPKSSKSPRSMVKMPSFNCLESKISEEIETSLVRSCSVRPPV